MALDKVVDSSKLDGAMAATAEVIRWKTTSTDKIVWDEETGFREAVRAINGVGLQEKTVVPKHSEQVIVPDEQFDGLSSVKVLAVPRVPASVANVEAQSPNVVETVVNMAVGVIVTAEEYEEPFDDTGVTCWFDCREGVTATAWENQYGDDDIELYNPIISDEHVEVVGSETSYGKLTHGGESGTSVVNQDHCTRYFVFKNTSGVFGDWRTIIGNESANWCCSTIAMSADGGLKFTRADLLFTDYKCSDWHVLAVKSNYGGTTDIWVDGVSVGSAANCLGWAADTFLARGSGWSYSDNNTAFRAIVIADVSHDQSQIVHNSNWLKKHFIDNFATT